MALEMTNLKGRTAVVSGAGQGIGFAIVQALVAVGASVVAIDRDTVGFEALKQLSGVTPFQADVTDKDLPKKLDDIFDRSNTQLDILINNAGIGRGGHAVTVTDEELQTFLDVNFIGVFRLSRWAVKRMMKTGKGAIVNTASIFGLVGAQNSCGYSASKAAVIGLTRQMATDYGPNGIRVNAVAPGLIDTPLVTDRIKTETWRRQIFIDQSPLRRVGYSEDIARVVRFLASDESDFMTGQVVSVDGGWAMGRFPREIPIEAEA